MYRKIMENKSGDYIKRIEDAEADCGEATRSLINCQTLIEEKWSGAAGEAMLQKLQEKRGELQMIRAKLTLLAGKMRTHTQTTLDNWPTDSVDIPV